MRASRASTEPPSSGPYPHPAVSHEPRIQKLADDLAPAYPRWADFAAVRDRLDPERVFGNAHLDRVLGP